MKTKNNQGYVLVLAMIGLMTLMFFLLTGVSTTTSSVKVSGNYAKTVDSFNYAEVGLAKARPTIEAATFDTMLSTYANTPLIAKTAYNEGFYQVYVYDNDDGDGSLTNDSDDIIVAKSIGTNSVGGTVTIEAYLQKPTASAPVTLPPNPGSGPGAAMMCGTASDLRTQGSARISGYDYGYPTMPCSGGGCAGVNCNTSPNNTTDSRCPGMQSPAQTLSTTSKAAVGEGTLNLAGSGYTSPVTPTTSSSVAGTNCSSWRTLRDQLVALDSSNPDVVILSGSSTNSELNTCANPKIFIINTSASTYQFSGSAALCGVLVVASNTAIETVGNVVIIGLVLVMGDSATLNFVASSGTPRIFGQVIVQSTSTDVAKELEVKGTAEVNFSTTGRSKGLEAINAALTSDVTGGSALVTMAWKETY